MRFNNKLILSLLTVVPSTLAAVNGKCSYGKKGICISTSTCTRYGGSSSVGNCPNDRNDIRCCDNIPCKHNNVPGICKFTNECSGTTYSGHCPGGSDFKCCVTDTTKGVGESCAFNGRAGRCINVNKSSCEYDIVSGQCPGPSNVKCCLSSKSNKNEAKISQAMQKIVSIARKNIGGTEWAANSPRECKRNKNVVFVAGENKCNLFVYEVLLAAGIDIGTPNTCGRQLILRLEGKCARPPTAKDWYDGKVKHFEYFSPSIGSYLPGDIITSGGHVGIISGNRKTISASGKENKVVENDWGFRSGQSVRVYRYTG